MNSSDILLLLSDKYSLHLLYLMCVMTTDLSKHSTCSDFLDVSFWLLSIQLPVSLLFMLFSTARLSFVGMNKIMIGKALGLWNFIYSKTAKTVPDTVFVQGICHFPSVIAIFLSHEAGRIMLTARLTPQLRVRA